MIKKKIIYGEDNPQKLSKKFPMLKRRKKSPEEIAENKAHTEKRNAFFMEIWASRPHKCEVCGKFLGNEARTYHFDHVLEKSKFPEYEFDADNIMLICFEDHDKKSRGFHSPVTEMRIKQLKTKYGIV